MATRPNMRGDDDPIEFVGAPDFAEETKPQRRRTAKPKPPITTKGKPSLKEPIGGLLLMLNLPVQMFAPRDALDPAELEALASALDEQAKISPRFRRYVEAMIGVGSGGQLIVVTGVIVGRRMARHGFLPNGEQADTVLGKMLSDSTHEPYNVPAYPQAETPEPMPDTGEQSSGIPAVGGTEVSTPS